jgi:hypothetical protein
MCVRVQSLGTKYGDLYDICIELKSHRPKAAGICSWLMHEVIGNIMKVESSNKHSGMRISS